MLRRSVSAGFASNLHCNPVLRCLLFSQCCKVLVLISCIECIILQEHAPETHAREQHDRGKVHFHSLRKLPGHVNNRATVPSRWLLGIVVPSRWLMGIVVLKKGGEAGEFL